jgi:hypothetical protein
LFATTEIRRILPPFARGFLFKCTKCGIAEGFSKNSSSMPRRELTWAVNYRQPKKEIQDERRNTITPTLVQLKTALAARERDAVPVASGQEVDGRCGVGFEIK